MPRPRYRRHRRAVARRPAVGLVFVTLVATAIGVALVRRGDDQSRAAQANGPAGAIALDRGWRYRQDPQDVGLARRWQARPPTGRRVALPWVANAVPISGPAGRRGYDGSVGWFSTRFSVGRGGVYSIHFGSVSHYAIVWLDGHRQGTHVGAYDPFEVRARLRPDTTHVLTVRADWRFPALQRKRGWNRGWFNFGGINRPVSLERIGHSEPAQPRIWTRLVHVPGVGRAALVRVQVRVRNNDDRRRVRVVGFLRRSDQEVVLRFPAAVVPRGRTHVFETTTTVVEPALWSPGRPRLYDLDVEVPGESLITSRVGLREVRWRRGRLYLNGNRLVMRGASLPPDAQGHGDALTAADQERIVAELKAIGANATRAQQRLDPALLNRLDAAGILVWQEIGPWDAAGDWTATTPTLLGRARQRAIDAFAELQAHPSIVAWSLGNEVAGQGHPGGQEEHIQFLTDKLHELDPGRLVAVDLWGRHLPRFVGPLYVGLDAVGFTDYHGWYEEPGVSGAALRDLVTRRAALMRSVFADKVLVVTEFGAAANRLNPAHAIGGADYQSEVLAQHIRAYRGIPDLSGMLIWSLRDYALTPAFTGGSFVGLVPGVRLNAGLNEKGLFDYAGKAKSAAAVVSSEFARAGGVPSGAAG